MELLTIGAFARVTRLSPKALRLYDELGLLRPALVDGESGYRYYDPAQVERARLIAWLRRLGMPLARIGRVCDLPAAEAAVEVAAYRDDVVAEAEAREQLASFLVDYLSGRGHTMVELGIRYAARSDAGAVRTSNEDTAYAGRRLWAVADGMRGPGGDQASAAAVAALRVVENADMNAGDLLNVLADAVQAADRAVGVVAETVPDATPATTLTAILWSGSELALVHIGDTRAYVLRDGALSQITHDHTYVQGLIDDGKLTAAEAESHPQRAMLTRALTGDGEMRPDLSMHAVHAGDRYLLCSDGLSTVVTAEQMTAALARGQGPAETVDYLVTLAQAAGAPDNIACVVADVVPL